MIFLIFDSFKGLAGLLKVFEEPDPGVAKKKWIPGTDVLQLIKKDGAACKKSKKSIMITFLSYKIF